MAIALASARKNVTEGPDRRALRARADEISPFYLRGDTVAVEDDPLAEAMRFLLDAQSSVQEVSL